jgi:hypothetical protein
MANLASEKLCGHHFCKKSQQQTKKKFENVSQLISLIVLRNS